QSRRDSTSTLEHLVSGFGFSDAEWDLVGDGDAIALEGYYLFRMICQNSNIFEAEIYQDLRADAAFVLNHAEAGGLAVELAALVKVNLRQRTRFARRFHAESAAGVMKIEKHSAILFGDGGKRARDQFVAIAGGRAEYVAGQAVRMHAY